MLKKEMFFHANLCGFAKEYPGARSIGFSAIFVPPKSDFDGMLRHFV